MKARRALRLIRRPPTLDLTGEEYSGLRAEMDSFIDTWTTLPELHTAVCGVVRAHGYTPAEGDGAVRQEMIGAASWIVETDRGPVRVTL